MLDKQCCIDINVDRERFHAEESAFRPVKRSAEVICCSRCRAYVCGARKSLNSETPRTNLSGTVRLQDLSVQQVDTKLTTIATCIILRKIDRRVKPETEVWRIKLMVK